ncbi:replication protein [Staphylococcus saprophyticus]|uniref:replication initiator protein A n=1 Tax=Staphylococcus saprophyticus TaxID=29385 RepID=UPI00085305DF|nr:replication initiator protein A [Staphylococcus saprophyticus]MDW4192123.1 replication initiator protein A [Staphylococcus saprophyticus]OEK90600.1 replication protein [Staphylococcus saprophyticus]
MSRKNIKNQASQNFYMLHKVLFINEKYKKLSDSAKVTYAILNDRVSLSIKNNWIDQNGDIYFIFTNENLQEVLDKSKNTITKIKKELQEVGLLEQVKTGFNRPNKLYLHEIETNINIEKEIQNSTSNNDESSDSKESQIMGVQNPKQWESRIPNNGSPESQNLDSNDTDLSNTDYIETENNDTHDMNDTYNNQTNHNHSNHTNHQQTEFNNDALKFQVLEELPQQLQDYLSKFEIREIRIIKSVLLKGKKSFNNAHDTFYRLEDVEFELVSVLKRFKAMLLQKNETIEAMQGYLMQSIKAELEEIHALNMRRQNMKQHNIFNQ